MGALTSMTSHVSPRLILGLLTAVLVTAALGAIGLRSMGDVQDRTDRLATHSIPEIINAGGAAAALHQYRALQLQHSLAPSLDEMARVAAHLRENEDLVQDHLERFRHGVAGHDRDATAARLLLQWRQYLQESAPTTFLDQSDRGEQERAVLTGHAGRIFEAISRSLEAIQEKERSEASRIHDVGNQAFKTTRLRFSVIILGAVALISGIGLWLLVIGPLRNASAVSKYRHSFLQALEMTDTEDEAINVTGRALRGACPELPVEVLLADSSEAHLERAIVVGPDENVPRCPVGASSSCAAIRSGRPIVFPSSESIDACPHLRDRPTGPCSAVCTPMSVLGRALGVMHAVGPVGKPPRTLTREILEVSGALAGSRLGVIRAFRQSQLQASADPLTGLLNRRSLEEGVHSLRTAEVPYVVAMADLDHFKKLNDTHGHETGDRALRVFTRVLEETTRVHDLVGRYGGEEFVVVLPRSSTAEAADVIARTRVALKRELAETGVPTFTFSAGLADAGPDETFQHALMAADEALLAAKRSGRDRTLIASSIRKEAGADPRPLAPDA